MPASPKPRAPARPPSLAWAPSLARTFGGSIALARDALARGLARAGVTPDGATLAGAVFSLVGGACLAVGAAHTPPWEQPVDGLARSLWPSFATLWLLFAGAMDMLDGALARQGGGGSARGALLDSTTDRVSDFAVFGGCALHFAVIGQATLAALALSALCSGFLISYVKARADSIVAGVGGGYWQRGERYCFLCLGSLVGHVPAALWLLALLPWCTVAWRVRAAFAALGGHPLEESRAPLRRGTRAYDVLSVALVLFVLVAPWLHPWLRGVGDPLGAWLRAAQAP